MIKLSRRETRLIALLACTVAGGFYLAVLETNEAFVRQTRNNWMFIVVYGALALAFLRIKSRVVYALVETVIGTWTAWQVLGHFTGDTETKVAVLGGAIYLMSEGISNAAIGLNAVSKAADEAMMD